jgi:ABC-type dipeptide/oligopeptide/nickel transport system permease component
VCNGKGFPDTVVHDRHPARNALLPTVTSLVLSLANDYRFATGALVFTDVFLLIAHFFVDMLHVASDPRIFYIYGVVYGGEPVAER